MSPMGNRPLFEHHPLIQALCLVSNSPRLVGWLVSSRRVVLLKKFREASRSSSSCEVLRYARLLWDDTRHTLPVLS